MLRYRMSWRYIAGFFDGEGSVYFNKSPYKRVRVSLSQNDKTVLTVIKSYLNNNNIDSCLCLDKRSDCYLLTIGKRKHILKFLLYILPYIVVKHDKVIEAIKYIINIKNEKGWLDRKEKELIIKLRKEGLTYGQIGNRLNRSGAAVHKYFTSRSLN